ncbi:hypothetical protein [Gelidibacter maritimus]|uniref:Uncharacterized protein n=1 Tax=Gelidibacter maritimus TaxID=2761487 RepID=A0A7W2M7Q6_9FLAO|nr:hypothetical protein [Gelidibacter maritimus]MBA6154269.1 hypothetical protein [Gelidibacter maritimus]
MIKQNPFSIYDFLGYLVPGSILIYSYLIIDYAKKHSEFILKDFMDEFLELKFEGIFFFVILSYTLGHLISFTSSVTIEKYANWTYSYPSKYLLDMDFKSFWKSIDNLKDFIWRILIIVILFPCILFDLIFGQFLGFKRFYTKELDKLLQDIIIHKLNKLLIKLGIQDIEGYTQFENGLGNESDFHRIATHYAYENSKKHQSKMTNYVALYGFLRTLCFIFNSLALYTIVRVWIYLEFDSKNILIILALSGISYLSFMAFMKFYRRYTLEGLMVIAIDETL